ncbi:MAG: response regulator, partial [Planctomycetes bacterium]|nr:response regulator [Planctomycetota bacterium]
MLSFLQNIRIKYKIVLVTMLTCITVLIVTNAIMILWTQDTLRDSITRNLNTQAEILAENCKAAMAFEDREDAAETLAALRTQSSVVAAAIYTSDNKIFTSYKRDKNDSNIKLSEFIQGGKYSGNFFVVSSKIVLDGETLGTIIVKSDLSMLNKAFRRNIKVIAGLLAITILVAYMLSSKLQKIISGPILALTRTAKTVSQEKKYTTRAIKKTNDEIGDLIDSFNEMLSQIHQRDMQMVEMNENLEEMVRDRTSDLTREIERADSMAQESLRASNIKSQFLANMSHEIRTPMNAVIGFSDVLADDELTETQHEFVNLIRTSGKNLMQIINDILDISKIEAGECEIENTECDIVKLLDSIEPLIRQKVAEKGIGFEIVIDETAPSIIATDPTRLKQCLINLIHNAVKFTDVGYVHINVSMEKNGNENFVRFDVIDTGIGIPAEKQKHIFQPFTQADTSHSRTYGGTGLGLAITKQLTRLLGGQLTLTSEEGKGSIFSLAIPAGLNAIKHSPVDSKEIAENKNNEESMQTELSGRILVAEDAKTNQVLIKLLLEKLGLEVTIVEDGNEALENALEKDFDLILMDIQMPKIN